MVGGHAYGFRRFWAGPICVRDTPMSERGVRWAKFGFAVGIAVGTAVVITAAGCASSSPAERRVEPVVGEVNVNPEINERFIGEGVTAERVQGMLESESREVFAHRAAIAAAVGLEPGESVADIGAGTGIFMSLFADAVGDSGRVYSVEIGTRLVALLKQLASDRGHSQVEVVLGTTRSVNLPEKAVDVVFICDVYHHFEYPKTTMSTIRRALRRGGELIIVDFEKIPGVTREFIMGHVRADKIQVIAEISQAGFTFLGEVDMPELEENYLLRFRLD